MNGRSGGRVVAAGVLLAMVLVLAGPAGASSPPDRVDPSAPGEARPPADPSEPDDPGFTAAAHPTASYRPGVTTTWPRPRVTDAAGTDRFATAVAASKLGWPETTRAVVVTRGDRWAPTAIASALAGAARGPLLYTRNDVIHPASLAEIKRLRPKVVYAIGVSTAVQDQLRKHGLRVDGVNAADHADLSYKVARFAIDAGLGIDPSSVVVTGVDSPGEGLPATALAGGMRYPLLLTPAKGGEKALADRVAALGSARVYVVGSTGHVPDSAVAGLPVRRLAGSGVAATSAVVGSEARRLGLTGTPALAAAELGDAMVAGALAGARKAPMLATGSTQLTGTTMTWLSRTGPGQVAVVRTGQAVGRVARCQLGAGAARPFRCVEAELARQGYNVGAVDGRVDHQTVWSFFAFKKVARLPVTTAFGEADWKAMLARPTIKPRRTDLPARHVEIDLSRQLVLLFDGGRLQHAFHTSSGKPSTPTVRGTFTVYEKRPYYQPHNRMYKSIFFFRGYAVHGYPEIPTYPASAGCARTYNGDQDFLYPKVRIGDRVAVY
jgi:hypothetical protein